MAFNVTFYTGFEKRLNSTRLPTGDGTVYQCELKDRCSILHPTITIHRLGNDESPEKFNYCMIPKFLRYYFINDWTWENGIWMAHMTVDVLASWKNDIGGLSEYIMRTDSTSAFNGAIMDKMYPATNDFSIDRTVFANPFVETLSQGTYVVGIINGDSEGTVGAITYYAMTPTEFANLKSYLYSDNNLILMGITNQAGDQLEEISKEVFRAIYNPFQYISSCMWFPVLKSDINGTQYNRVKLGWWEYPVSGKVLTAQTGYFSEVAEIPLHPQTTRGKYLNYSPYTRRTLHGKFGAIPIDCSYFETGDYMMNTYRVDYITGKCRVEIFASETSAGTNPKLITETEFLIGTPIQIAQVSIDYLGTAVNAIDTLKDSGLGAIMGAIGTGIAGGIGGTAIVPVGGTVAGASAGALAGAFMGAVISAGQGIYDTINASMPQTQVSGTNGSFINGLVSSVLISEFFVITDEDITHKGRPLCEIRTINTLSGYIMCADGDHDIGCMTEESTAISKFLTNGFFWE